MSSLAGIAADHPPGSDHTPEHARYELLTELGRGGMGVVHRALDRLTGRVVALKHVLLSPSPDEDNSEEALAVRQAFASEFATLCSVRHPNIVSVLDYGFDGQGSAFFTMELYEGAEMIHRAVSDEPFAVQVDLVVQLLRAIHYLHQRGILHRDLKPSNVLVHNGQVKILDFGVAVRRDTKLSRDERAAGTMAYMAPEVLWGGSPNEASDLYSLGVLLFEMFAGSLPPGNPFTQPVALDDDDLQPLDPRLRKPIRSLLAPKPEGRPSSAWEALMLLTEHTGQKLTDEPVAIRESWLRTAPLVGRAAELGRLTAALERARGRRGSAWLLQGSSGVGKTRLVDELRTAALVGGFDVFRGQAAAHGDSPYEPWQPIISALALGATGLEDLTASVVMGRFPDVEGLFPQPPSPLPPLEAQAAQARFFQAVVALCQAQRHPALIILEDAHWAGSESLDLVASVARSARDARLVVVVTSRVEEDADLGALLPAVEVIDVAPLDEEQTSTLTASMTSQELSEGLLRYVCHQSTGVPLFVLELMRELAEQAGGLDRLSRLQEAPRSLPTGILRLLRKRLARFPADLLPQLRVAAVVGRTIDLEILEAIDPELDVELLIRVGSDALVLDADGRQWRFRHDKLREALLDDLDDETRQSVHRQVAEAIVALRPDAKSTAVQLVHHYREAGMPDEELRWITVAAEDALAGGATKEAAAAFERAVELTAELNPGSLTPRPRPGLLAPDPMNAWLSSEDTRRTMAIYEGIALAYFDGGDLRSCLERARVAFAFLGTPFPRSRRGWFIEAARALVTRFSQALLRPQRALDEDHGRLAMRHLRLLRSLSDVALYAMDSSFYLSSVLWRINHSFPLRPNAYLDETKVYLAFVLMTLGAKRSGGSMVRSAVERVASDHSETEAAVLRSRVAVIHIMTSSFELALEELGLAEGSARRTGDQRLLAEVHGIRAMTLSYRGDFAGSGEQWAQAFDIAKKNAIHQVTLWGHLGRADCQLRIGDLDAAGAGYRAIEDEVTALDDSPYQTEHIWLSGMFGLAKLRQGRFEEARASATHALERAEQRDQLCYWLLQGQCAMAEALIRHCERTGEAADVDVARRAVKQLRRMAATQPFAAVAAQYWSAELARVRGQRGAARRGLRRALKAAKQQRRPYEEALCRRSLAQVQDSPDELRSAAELFRGLDAHYEADEVEALID